MFEALLAKKCGGPVAADRSVPLDCNEFPRCLVFHIAVFSEFDSQRLAFTRTAAKPALFHFP
jgi:hypothetical protein